MSARPDRSREIRQRTCRFCCLAVALSGLAGASAAVAAPGEGATQSTPVRVDPRGRFSLRDTFLTDNQSEHTTHLLTGDLDIYLPRLGGSPLTVVLDGEIRKDLSEHPALSDKAEDYAQQDPHPESADKEQYLGRSDRSIGRIRGGTLSDYIRSAYVEYAGLAGLFTAQGGRMMLTDLGQTWVDGAVVRADVPWGLQAGVFGGLAPDPLDYGFNLDHQTFGAFSGYTSPSSVVRLAFNQSNVDGETDRRFLFSSGHFGLFDSLFLSYGTTVDLAGQRISYPSGDWTGEQEPLREDLGPQVTLGYVNLLWWVTPGISLTLSGNTFRNVPFRVSQPAYTPTELDRDILKGMLAQKEETPNSNDLPSWIQRLYLGDSTSFPAYYGLRFSPAVRFGNGYYAFLSMDWRSRELDGQEAHFISVGTRGENLLESEISGRVEYTARNSFLSDSSEVTVSLSRTFFDRVELGAYGTWLDGRSMAKTFGRDLLLRLRENQQDPRSAPDVSPHRVDQRQQVWLCGATLDIDITKRLYLVIDYEFTHESLTAEEDQEGDALTLHGLNARLTLRL